MSSVTYFTNAQGKSVCVPNKDIAHNFRINGLRVDGEDLQMTYQTFDHRTKPVTQPNVVEHNTAMVCSWILASEKSLRQSPPARDVSDGCWPSTGMFVRGSDFMCRDMRLNSGDRVTYEIGARTPLVIVHSDGLSIGTNRFSRHLDVEGQRRTNKTALRVAELALAFLHEDCHLKSGLPLVLFLDTRGCEVWYCKIFEVYFSRHQSLIKVYFSDVSRRSLCDPNDVEATNSSYRRMLASMPPMESVKDVKFKTDSCGLHA